MQASRTITRRSASNLALAFALLPRDRRDAMSALYAFCREVDDVADEATRPAEARRATLAEWRADVQRACGGQCPTMAVNQELQPWIEKFHLPFTQFEEVLHGCEMDLDTLRYPTLQALEHYCYHVASAVGLLSIRIFGFRNPQCNDYAVHLGKALQLTNILRDVKNDADRGRIYLPQEELERGGVSEAEILAGTYSARYAGAAEGLAARAREHYQAAQRLLPAEDRRSMVAAELMGSVYWRLLRKLEAARFDVFGPSPVRLGSLHKVTLVLRAWWRHALHAAGSDYATP
jgi:phytoene synthase